MWNHHIAAYLYEKKHKSGTEGSVKKRRVMGAGLDEDEKSPSMNSTCLR